LSFHIIWRFLIVLKVINVWYSLCYKKKKFVYGAKPFYLCLCEIKQIQPMSLVCSYPFCPPFAGRRTDSGKHVCSLTPNRRVVCRLLRWLMPFGVVRFCSNLGCWVASVSLNLDLCCRFQGGELFFFPLICVNSSCTSSI